MRETTPTSAGLTGTSPGPSVLAFQRTTGPQPFVASPGPATLAGELPVPGGQPVVDDIVLLDPVCGMIVDRAYARHLAEHEGVVYAFRSMGCRASFMREPSAYLPASVSSAD